MPDRYGDPDGELAPGVAAPQTVPDEAWAAERRREAIVACGLCDDDGYNAARRVCDHVDHASVYTRRYAELRKQMGWDAPRDRSNPPTPTQPPRKD